MKSKYLFLAFAFGLGLTLALLMALRSAPQAVWAASQDRFVKPPLARLWFDSSFRWIRTPGTTVVRVAGGRVLAKASRLDAIDVYTQAMNSYELKEDATAKELRYNLARAYEEQGEPQKALDVYRKIAQFDFAYKDVSQRVDELRNKTKKPTSQ